MFVSNYSGNAITCRHSELSLSGSATAAGPERPWPRQRGGSSQASLPKFPDYLRLTLDAASCGRTVPIGSTLIDTATSASTCRTRESSRAPPASAHPMSNVRFFHLASVTRPSQAHPVLSLKAKQYTSNVRLFLLFEAMVGRRSYRQLSAVARSEADWQKTT